MYNKLKVFTYSNLGKETNMKKLLIVLVLSLTMLAGCAGGSGQKLACTLKEEGSSVNVVVNHKDNKATKISFKGSIDIPEGEKESVAFAVGMLKSYFEGIKNSKVEQQGNKIVIEFSIDLKDQEQIDKLGDLGGFTGISLTDDQLDINTIKNELEASGFTCK